MKPVKQTILHSDDANGNCFAAALASVMEWDIEDCPDIFAWSEDRWWFDLRQWMLERGYWVLSSSGCMSDLYCIGVGKSPRGAPGGHAVVCLNGEIVHDPHPSNDGLDGRPTEYWTPVRVDHLLAKSCN